MSISADTLKRLAALGLPGEAMQEVLSIIASCIEPLETRRQRDRERKRGMENPRKFHGKSTESPAEIPAVHIDTSLTKDSIKKVSKKTISAPIDVPEDASEENRTYAESKGWDTRKTASEWQRFRDHSLARGKKHRNVNAAWRNWVTSPYQSRGPVNVGASGRYSQKVSPITAALEQHTRDIASGFDGGGEVCPPAPRLISNGRS